MGDELDFLRDANETPSRGSVPAKPAAKPVAKAAAARPAQAARPVPAAKPVAAARAVAAPAAAPAPAARAASAAARGRPVRGRPAQRGARPGARYPLLDTAALVCRVLAGLLTLTTLGAMVLAMVAEGPVTARLGKASALAGLLLARPCCGDSPS